MKACSFSQDVEVCVLVLTGLVKRQSASKIGSKKSTTIRENKKSEKKLLVDKTSFLDKFPASNRTACTWFSVLCP